MRDTYAQLLQDVGARAADMDGRPIACHWPFVGSEFSGTLIVGQAAGWDAAETTVRWPVEEVATEAGCARVGCSPNCGRWPLASTASRALVYCA